MALSGLKVLEFAGLAPSPFAGLMLADFGARVVRIDRVKSGPGDSLSRGKRSIALNLKQNDGIQAAKKLCSQADILIEPYRPGIMEKLGLGPQEMTSINPKLIYARLTGFGQTGYYAPRAGHDLNYMALTGLLSLLGRRGEKPTAPLNLMADFAGGGMMCVVGILMALIHRSKSGKGQIIDANMVQGASYLGSWMWTTRSNAMVWPTGERGNNLLDTGAPFYDTYRTADDKYLSVAALEPQFYQQLVQGLGLENEEDLPSQADFDEWPKLRKRFSEVIAQKTRDEWCRIFDGRDACVAPVLTLDEAVQHPHNVGQGNFLQSVGEEEGGGGVWQPRPAPGLSESPASEGIQPQPQVGQHTEEVLLEAGYTRQQVTELAKAGAVELGTLQSSL